MTVSLEMIAVLAAALVMALTWFVWWHDNGPLRSSLSILCRVLWLWPIFAGLFPRVTSEPVPQQIQLTPVQLFFDDSESIVNDASYPSVLSTIEELESRCVAIGCALKIVKMSDIDARTKNGLSPINESLDSWSLQLDQAKWIVLSDGADSKPSVPWAANLANIGAGAKEGEPSRGMVIAVGDQNQPNIWIDQADFPPFSFDGQPFAMKVGIRRAGGDVKTKELRVQVQVQSGDRTLTSTNALFAVGEESLNLDMVVPPLRRGSELLKVSVLPVPEENALWDNSVVRAIEVLPNTIGVLHLLGSPSWDGRFVRRFLKSEPKYDMISFFILRDRWDSQSVNERELSLIPFPVERLFKEELSNFKVVVIQNFALFEFLQPEYQQNLVDFVKAGGGLLFVGGPRALQNGDLYSSALSTILPFSTSNKDGGAVGGPSSGVRLFGAYESTRDRSGPFYDAEAKYTVQLAEPDENSRSLVTVFDDWAKIAHDLGKAKGLTGIHRLDQVNLKKNGTTVLLDAKLEAGKSIPLAVASYPEKGRALWVFSDSLWRMAIDAKSGVARSTYDEFMAASMNWLLRNELEQPLTVKDVQVSQQRDGRISWNAVVSGPAARYLQLSDAWRFEICGDVQNSAQISATRIGSGEVLLSGSSQSLIERAMRCTLKISGTDAAFGSVNAQARAVVPEQYLDKQLAPSQHRMESLAGLTKAKMERFDGEVVADVSRWLEQHIEAKGGIQPARNRVTRNFFWMFDRPIIWLLLLFLPLEVMIRRWHNIFGQRLNRYRATSNERGSSTT